MLRGQGSKDSKLRGGHPSQRSARVFPGVHGLKNGEESAASAAPRSSSLYALMGATAREEPGLGIPLTTMAPMESSQRSEGSSSQEVDSPGLSQDKETPQIMQGEFVSAKLDKIVRFLIQKYQKKEQITMEEMTHIVENDSPDDFPVIIRKICQCMRLAFGIIMREVDCPGHKYELVPLLGLTYSGILNDDDQIIPKADLLIVVLSVIFLKGNRVSEEYLREIVRHRKSLADKKHIVIGEHWKFITEDLVREEYLVYQQVPHSDPPRYEFLWGPRAHAETTRMKVLEHVFMLDGTDPRSHPELQEQALRAEKGILSASAGQDESQ
ncbi:PREDICTED: melanoma-associated antigen 8-like [Chinchilla lanigera]|uniref:melanoma-associated antigen 8-like n=1 Tax=Chinchilla lanigera TaxID=34839 RepID=UPI00038EF48B|nr:PREDICTED: melanoma-associated antigen 8-like [Chinchilla lanigera]